MALGFKNFTSVVALAAIAGVFAGGATRATAADLGGDCCADLEERIAELEATTARKGNRKVSLEVYGHINEAMMWWDDGTESNLYVVGNDSGRSRFGFKGKAKITSDWEAGYLLEIGVRTSRSDRVNQFTDDGESNGFDIRHSAWYVKSKTYGALWVGQSNTAAESVTEINLSQTSDIAKPSDVEDFAAGFLLRSGGVLSANNTQWRRLVKDDFLQPGEGNRANVVRYISPTFAGFEASASYGEDDYWDAALRYKGEFNGIKIAAGIAYGEGTEGEVRNTDTPGGVAPAVAINSADGLTCIVTRRPAGANKDADCHQIGGSLSIMHEPTGLFLNFGAGQFTDENTPAGQDEDHTFYNFQGGIEKKWLPFGKTTIYGEYFDHSGGFNDRAVALGGANGNLISSDVEMFGIGIIQGVDSAAMRLYTTYRHFDADMVINNGGAAAAISADDLDVVMSGALIKF